MKLTQNLQNLKNKQSDDSEPHLLAGTNSVLKIMSNHSHIIISLLMFPFDWNGDLANTIKTTFSFLNIGVSEAISNECLLIIANVRVNFLYFKLLSNILFPIMLVVIYLILDIMQVYISKRKEYSNSVTVRIPNKRRQAFLLPKAFLSQFMIIKQIVNSMRRKVSFEAIFIIVFMFCWVKIAHSVGYTLFYIDIGYDGNIQERLFWQPDIQISSSYHQKWVNIVSIPSLVIFGILFPAFIVIR